MKYKVKDGQTNFDIAEQFYGSLEYLFILLEDNNISATTIQSPGTTLEIRDNLIVEPELPIIANLYSEI